MTKAEAISQLQERIDLINKDYFDLQLDKYAEALELAIEALNQFAEDSKKVSAEGQDLISRQALCEYALNQIDKSVTPNDIMRFPSAQPDIIRCGECRHLHDNDCPVVGWGRDDDDYCAWAERDNDG